jgi:hypothetical protein
MLEKLGVGALLATVRDVGTSLAAALGLAGQAAGCAFSITVFIKPGLVCPVRRGDAPVTEFAVNRAGVLVAPAHFQEVGACLATVILFAADAAATRVFATTARSGARGPLAESGDEAVNGAVSRATLRGL